jgi:hypothetical protein
VQEAGALPYGDRINWEADPDFDYEGQAQALANGSLPLLPVAPPPAVPAAAGPGDAWAAAEVGMGGEQWMASRPPPPGAPGAAGGADATGKKKKKKKKKGKTGKPAPAAA